MAKKNNTPKQIPNKDVFSRISYLYNLSTTYDALNPILSRAYSRNLIAISKKTTSRVSPSVKRTLCKNCNAVLIPGLTMSMRIENKSKNQTPHNDVFIKKCLYCDTAKRYPIGKDLEYIPNHQRVEEDTNMS